MRLASLLSSRGHRVTILEHGRHCYARNRDLSGQIHFKIVNCPWDLSVPFYRNWQFLRSQPADVGLLVKSVFTAGGIRSDLAAWLCHRRLLTIEHSPPDAYPEHRVPRLVRRVRSAVRSRFPSRVICVSNAIRNQLQNQEGYPGSKLEMVHHGVDTSEFCPSEHIRREVRQQWGIPQEALVFGFVGRLSPEKGVGTAIASFSRFRGMGIGQDAWLVLAGEGRERASLEAAAQAQRVKDRVLFVGFQKRPQEIYPGFSYVLLPSIYEGFGLALLEGMACGCPGIAMNVGGIPEVLSNPNLGWLIPAGDREAFANAMVQAAQLKTKDRAQMGRAAREHAVSNFDLDASLESIIRIIEE